MNLERYPYIANKTYLDFEFDSKGPKGVVRKVVRFTRLDDDLYNLGFGDLEERTGKINDLVTSNNSDTEKVLATVSEIADKFMLRFPHAIVAIQGTTKARTRLYQMNIAAYWDEINKVFEVRGLRHGKWEAFRKGINYDAFAARRLQKN